jgi:hypothetical protein
MPRLKQLVTRDHQLNVSLTLAEREVLQRRADAVGLRLAIYARAVLLGEEVRRETVILPSSSDRLVYQQWVRAGSNLNQIARRLNALGDVSASEVDLALRNIRELIARART